VFVSLYGIYEENNQQNITCETKENLLTRQSSLFKRERRGDSQHVIVNRLTSQQAASFMK
jgi:hypothetical protein